MDLLHVYGLILTEIEQIKAKSKHTKRFTVGQLFREAVDNLNKSGKIPDSLLPNLATKIRTLVARQERMERYGHIPNTPHDDLG